MDYPAFVGADYQSQSPSADQERLVNAYVEPIEAPGASQRAALYPFPGLVQIGTAMSSPGRGHASVDTREFAVYGTSFVEIDSAGTFTVRGTVATDANPATITSNGDGGNQLFVTSGGNGYVFNLTTNVLTQIAALNGKATMGDFLDGYFLALNGNKSTFYISALLDGATWATGTDFAQRSAGPDPWEALRVVGQFIWLLGQKTSEVWYDTGTGSFPFGLHPSGRVPYGIVAPFSVGEIDGALLWLGQTDIGQAFVLRAAGFQPEVVSDFPRQTIFGAYGTLDDATADTLNVNGHLLYVLTFPTEDATWYFDSRTSLWGEWEVWMAERNDYAALRCRYHVMAFGEHRMLDSATGALYRLDAATRTDVDSRPIRWLRRAPVLSADGARIYLKWFELLIQVGVGTATGQGADPQLMMRISVDGGHTWGMERWRSIGKIGKYLTRVRWERLGSGRYFVIEVSGTDPVPYRIVGATIELGQPVKGAQQQAAA